MQLTILFDRLRWEEKALKKEGENEGCEASLLDAKGLVFEVSTPRKRNGLGDLALQRCISHYRGLYLTKILENMSLEVVNSSAVTENCGRQICQ